MKNELSKHESVSRGRLSRGERIALAEWTLNSTSHFLSIDRIKWPTFGNSFEVTQKMAVREIETIEQMVLSLNIDREDVDVDFLGKESSVLEDARRAKEIFRIFARAAIEIQTRS